MDKIKLAFMFMVPGLNSEKDISTIDSDNIQFISVGVSDIDDAVKIAKKLVDEGVKAIELCSAFGYNDVTRITDAVGANVVIGVVRFDLNNSEKFKNLLKSLTS